MSYFLNQRNKMMGKGLKKSILRIKETINVLYVKVCTLYNHDRNLTKSIQSIKKSSFPFSMFSSNSNSASNTQTRKHIHTLRV